MKQRAVELEARVGIVTLLSQDRHTAEEERGEALAATRIDLMGAVALARPRQAVDNNIESDFGDADVLDAGRWPKLLFHRCVFLSRLFCHAFPLASIK